MKKTIVSIFFLCFLFSLVNAQKIFLPKAESFEPELQRELVIIDSTHPYNLNPQTATYAAEAQVLSGIYEGLFAYNPVTLEPEPAIAESFKISRNKLTWTITIRKNAKFSNGDPITASSVCNSWINLLNPNVKAPFASLLDCVVGVEAYRTGKTKDVSKLGFSAKNENTIVIKLTTPTEHLSKLLCHHAFSVLSEKKNVYSGAFTLEEYAQDHILLKKNPNYWDADMVAVPSVRFTLSDDMEQNTFLFNTGKVNWVSGSINTPHVLNKKAIALSSQFGTEYLFFKTKKSAFADPNVRNALIYAIPGDELRQNSIIKTTSLVLQLRGYPEVFGIPDYDEEAAISLLEEAGYNSTTNRLNIQLCFTDDSTSKKRAELLTNAWKKIGVDTTTQFITSGDYISEIKKSNADLFCYIWIGDFADPLAFLELFRGSSSLNETGWSNPAYDKLLEDAATIADEIQRYKKLAEAEQLLLDDGVLIPISHTISLNIVDTQVISGWYDNALNIHPLKYIRFVKPEPPANLVMADRSK